MVDLLNVKMHGDLQHQLVSVYKNYGVPYWDLPNHPALDRMALDIDPSFKDLNVYAQNSFRNRLYAQLKRLDQLGQLPKIETSASA